MIAINTVKGFPRKSLIVVPIVLNPYIFGKIGSGAPPGPNGVKGFIMSTDLALRSSLRLSSVVSVVSINGGGIPDITPATAVWLVATFNQLIEFCGDLPVNELSPAMLQSWHMSNVERVAAATANSYLRAVKVVYSRLLGKGLIILNPAQYVRYVPEPDRRPRAVSLDTYNALRAVADVRDKAILDMLWASGCRLGGLLSMSLSTLDIWTDNGRPCLAVQVVEKFNRSRYVYAAGDQAQGVIDWLQIRPSGNVSAVFVGRSGRPLKRPSVNSIIRRLRLAAGVPAGVPCNPHSFRHAFAIRMLDSGVDLATVAAWMGHTDPMTTVRIYAVRGEEQLRSLYFSREA